MFNILEEKSDKKEETKEISNRINEAKRKQQALSDIDSGYKEWYVSKKSGYESGSEALDTIKSESRKYEVDFIGKQSIEESDNRYTISIETIGKLVNTLKFIDMIEKISYTKHKYVEISYDDGQTRAKLQYVISKTPKK